MLYDSNVKTKKQRVFTPEIATWVIGGIRANCDRIVPR